MAADAEKAGDATKATQYTSAAETIANQLIQVEKDVESLKTMVFESTQASDQAKAAVHQNSRLLQEKIAEKSKLLSQLDQAKMQEEMNSAMAQLNESVGADVPSLAEVQEKIQARYAKAKATAELTEASVESRVLEVEQATANVEAQGRLSELRAELGLGGAAPAPSAAPVGAARRPPSNPPPDASRSGRRSRVRPCPDRSDSAGQHDEVVAVDDLVGHARREVAGVAAGDLAQHGGLDEHHAPGERDAVGADDVDRVALAEASGDVDDAGRQQARLALDERPPGAVVDGDRAGDAGGEGDPQLARRRACAGGPRRSCRRRRRRRHRPSTPGAAGVGDHRAHARPRGDARRLQLAGHAAAPPAAAAAAGADRQHRVVDGDPRDELGVGVRRAGRRCTARRGR